MPRKKKPLDTFAGYLFSFKPTKLFKDYHGGTPLNLVGEGVGLPLMFFCGNGRFSTRKGFRVDDIFEI